MRHRITATLAVLALAVAGALVAAPAQAATVLLPRVNLAVKCATNGTTGNMWADFEKDTVTGRRRPSRGGFTTTYTWNIAQITVLGVVGPNGYTKGAQVFNPDVHAASAYVPSNAPFATRSAVEIAIYVRFTDGKDCDVTLPSP
jgi:hypothetical protein